MRTYCARRVRIILSLSWWLPWLLYIVVPIFFWCVQELPYRPEVRKKFFTLFSPLFDEGYAERATAVSFLRSVSCIRVWKLLVPVLQFLIGVESALHFLLMDPEPQLMVFFKLLIMQKSKTVNKCQYHCIPEEGIKPSSGKFWCTKGWQVKAWHDHEHCI